MVDYDWNEETWFWSWDEPKMVYPKRIIQSVVTDLPHRKPQVEFGPSERIVFEFTDRLKDVLKKLPSESTAIIQEEFKDFLMGDIDA